IVQDLTGIAGQSYASNSAYISTNSGVVGLVDSNGRDMMYYGISELNSFALDFGSKGIITGRARCSSIEGTNNDYTWTDPTILDDLVDETGQEGAYHCYCQVDGFTMPNKVVQQVSGPWVYRSNKWGDYEYCASSCVGDCAQQLKYNNSDNMAFRKAVFVPTMCVQESYRINAGTYLPAGDDAPAKCPVGYYCPGIVNVKLDEENDQGLSKCPSEYPNSDEGATADTQCYTKCTINDVANSMTVVGNNYYGTGTDTCEATECAPGWLLDLGLGEYAACTDTLSYIEPGTYLPAGKTVVEICLPGSYCPGADNVSYNVDADQGIFACPTEYPNSYAGAKADTECYQTCKIDNGDVTTSGNGNIYYGDENNTCELTECADGWMLKDFAKKIGTESGINSAYVSTNSMSYGQFVEEEWVNDSVMGQMYYGISEPGEFAVGFGENGVITGRGRCSTKSGVKNYDWDTQEYSEITTFDELDDESGNDDARYCYCYVDSYTSVGGLTQVLSGMPWVFNSESWSGEGCDSYCAQNCVSIIRDNYTENIAFRAVVFGAKPEDPAICIEESYRLNPGMYLMAGEDTPTKCPSGSYCPGAGDVILNSDKNQGIVKCPSGYPYSDTGATDDTQCYSLCTTDDVANSTSV
ncbi:MAG: hypothetical protein IKB59_01025, partial [Alphaproteobacteria bacterium]|nr:hypothetical protein [Alphaproteobacteria bacterium]